MAASLTLRWRMSGVECELRIEGTTGHVWLRRDGKIVGSAAVSSAVAAQEWATRQIERLREEPRGRAGTD